MKLILGVMPQSSILNDILAGIILSTFLVPIGMGYAEACGLPHICGLYASITPLIVYAFLGSSRVLILGPDSALVAVIAATVLPLAAPNSHKAVELASILAIFSGLICVLAGLCKLSFINDLVSKPIRYGFLNAIALTVLIGQLPKILGFSVNGFDLIQETTGLFNGILTNSINWTSCTIGALSLFAILACRRYAPKVPAILLAVLFSSILVSAFNLKSNTGVSVMGPLPQGLPSFRIPHLEQSEIIPLLTSALAIAMISLTDMSLLSRIFAQKGGYKVDENKELIALGAANISAGFFQGFCVTSSATRTPIAAEAGSKSQLTGLSAAICIILLLIFAPNLLQNVPSAVLAAAVISACLSLIEIKEVVRICRLRPTEFFSTVVCFSGVALLGAVQGIFIAVGFALLSFIWRAWRPHSAVLGRIDGLKGYHDITRHPEAKCLPGLIMFRWDAPLFFANTRIFQEQILEAVERAGKPVSRVIVEAEPVTDIDISAADTLIELESVLKNNGIELCFAQMKGPVKDQLKIYGIFQKIGAENFFPTLGQAVDHYVNTHHIEWHDWEDDLIKTKSVS